MPLPDAGRLPSQLLPCQVIQSLAAAPECAITLLCCRAVVLLLRG